MGITSIYAVIGMTCEHCARSVTDAVSKLAGVTGVKVDLPGGEVTVDAHGRVDDAAFAAAVDEAGYRVSR